MEVEAVMRFARRFWPLATIATIVGVAIGAVLFVVQPTVFRATAQVLVATESATTTAEIVQGSDLAISRVETYAELVGSDLVLDPVIEDLGLSDTTRELASRVAGAAVPATALIEVRADAPTADEAAAIANATSESLQAAVVEIESTPQAASPLALTVTDAATPPPNAASPHLGLTLGLGLALGLLLGVALALMRASADPRIDAEPDVRRLVDAPVLGRIATSKRDPMTTGSSSEELRSLRTSVKSLGLPAGARALLVAGAGEAGAHDATATAMGLATVLAESGARVLVIDAHLRDDGCGASHDRVDDVGLSDVLEGTAALRDAATPWQGTAVDLLPSGAAVTRSSELLDSSAMAGLIDAARVAYDWVLLDAPALPQVTDAAVLAQHADGVLLVVRERRTRTHELARAVDALDRAGAALLGVVLLASGPAARRRPRAEHAATRV